jgi:outer membrane autotransporter protein
VDESNAAGFDYSFGGLAAGVDYQFDAPVLLGAAFAYARTGIKEFTDVDAKSSGNTYRTSLYGALSNRLGYLGARVDYAYADFEHWRQVEFPGISERPKGSFDGNEISGSLEAGTRPFELGPIRTLPFLSLSYTYLGREGFAETGASTVGLEIFQEAHNSLTSGIGVVLDHLRELSPHLRLRGELRLRYDHEFLDHAPTMRATFDSQFFEVKGASVGRDTGLVGIGFEFLDRNDLSTFVGYDLRINSQLLEHNVNLGILFRF